MAKLNKDYISVFRYIRDAFYIPDNAAIKKIKPYRNLPPSVYHPREHHSYPDEETLQLLGGFQRLLDMRKDWRDTFKGYKTYRHVLRDMGQPLFGFAHIIQSMFTLLLAPLVFVIENLCFPFSQHEEHYPQFLSQSFNRFISWVVDGICTAVRGLTQIIFTPVMPLKIISRLSCGPAKIENNSGLQQVIDAVDYWKSQDEITSIAETKLGYTTTRLQTKVQATPDSNKKISSRIWQYIRSKGKDAADTVKHAVLIDEDQGEEAQQLKLTMENEAEALRLIAALHELHRKAEKAFSRGQATDMLGLTQEKEAAAFKALLTPQKTYSMSTQKLPVAINEYTRLLRKPLM